MRTIVPFPASTTNVSTLTTLIPFTIYSSISSLLFALVNYDSTNPVTLRVESSEDGIHPDTEFIEKIALPGQQASIEIGPEQTRSYWRVSAYTQSPSFPTVPVKLKVG